MGASWADKKSKDLCFEASSLSLHNNRKSFLNWIVMCNEKWILHSNWWQPTQWLDQKEAPKHFPKPNLNQKRSRSLFGGPLPVWPTTAFWIPAQPSHLRSMLSKSKRRTENCNTCSQHWSPERAQFSSTTTCARMWHNQPALGLRGSASSTVLTWPLARRLPLQASQQLFGGKTLPQAAEAENGFQEVTEFHNMDFFLLELNTYSFLAKNVLIVMVPILINRDVFEPSYNDLKFRVQNRYYFCSNLIKSCI